eukprot:Nk52_evm15s2630 gene=Nk52_evmTU15s2630
MQLNYKFIKSISFMFHPSHPRSSVIRETWRRCVAPKAIATNSKCEINAKLVDASKASGIEVVFSDKSKLKLQPREGEAVKEMLSEIMMQAEEIETKSLI